MAAQTSKMIDAPSRNLEASEATRKGPADEERNAEDVKTGEKVSPKSSVPNRPNGKPKYMPAQSPSTAAWLRGKAVAASAAAAARNKAAASVSAAAQEARKQKNKPPQKPKTAPKGRAPAAEIDSIKRRRKAKNDSNPDRTTKRNSLAKSGNRPPRAKKKKAPVTNISEAGVVTRRVSTDFTPSPGISVATGVARKPSKADDGSSTTSGSTPPKGKISEVSSVISDRKPPAIELKNKNDDISSSKQQSKKKLTEDDPALDSESKKARSTKKKKKLLASSDQSTKKSKRKLIKQDPALDGTPRTAPSRNKPSPKDTDDIVKRRSTDSDDKNKHRLRYASPVHGEKPRRSTFHQNRPASSKNALQKQKPRSQSQDEENEEGEDDSSSEDDVRATIPGAICIKEDDDGESFDGSELTPSVYTMDTRQIPVAAELVAEGDSFTETEAVKRMVALELKKERESQVIVEAVKVPHNRRASRPRSMLQLPSLAEEVNDGSNKHPPNYYCVACTLVCLLFVIILGIILGVTLKKEDAAPLPNSTFAPIIAEPTAAPVPTAPVPPTPPPTSGPTKNPVMENVLHIVLQRYRVLLNPTDADNLLEPNTPQFAAIDWMANEDEYLADRSNIVSGSEIAERYALAVLFYSTIGKDWLDDYGFLNSLSPGSVCDWGYGQAITCDGSNSITQLILCKSICLCALNRKVHLLVI